MAKVRHLLHGIVRLNMRGTSPERFLNLCTLAGLNVWQVKKEQANLLFYMEIHLLLLSILLKFVAFDLYLHYILLALLQRLSFLFAYNMHNVNFLLFCILPLLL